LHSAIIPALDGVYQALKFSIHLTPKFVEVRGTLKIRLHVRSIVGFRVFRRSVIAQAAGKAGLFQRVVTGESSFDTEFLVYARQAKVAESYLQDARIRRAVLKLFGFGYSMLVIDDYGLWTEKRDYDRKTDLEIDRVCAVLEILKALGTGVAHE
jgi:hypothetical protein